jgi:hypothetical protein
MVAEAIQPLREASINVGLGDFFSPCSPVLRTSSPSLMVASIAACHAAYEDKGGLSVLSEKVQNVPLPKDGVEGVVMEDLSVAWIEQASASSMEVMDVMTDTGIGPHDAYVLGNDVAIEVVVIS